MTCDLCDRPTRDVPPVSARLRNDAGVWVVIIRMCQSCAESWHKWSDNPVQPGSQPFLTTDAQFTAWLQLTPR